jgi:hypothetical protein
MAMTRIFERLYLSSAYDANDLAVSNPLGIAAVVNVHAHAREQES